MELKFQLDAIDIAAAGFIDVLTRYKIIAFHGDMGSGKTTFIRAVCAQLKVQDNVTSPTYAIINQYLGSDGIIYHLDLYRLKDEEEAIQAGVEECITSGNLCFIEWPEKIADILPERVLHVTLTVLDGGTRKLCYELE